MQAVNIFQLVERVGKQCSLVVLVVLIGIALHASIQSLYSQVIYSNDYVFIPPKSFVRFQIRLNPLDSVVGTIKSRATCTVAFCIDVAGIVLDPQNYPVAIFRINATRQQTTFSIKTMAGGNYTIILMNLISYEAYVSISLERVSGLNATTPQVLIPTTTITATTTLLSTVTLTQLSPTTTTSTVWALLLQPTTVTVERVTSTTVQQVSTYTSLITLTQRETVQAPSQQTATQFATVTTTKTVSSQETVLTTILSTATLEKVPQNIMSIIYALVGGIIIAIALLLWCYTNGFKIFRKAT